MQPKWYDAIHSARKKSREREVPAAFDLNDLGDSWASRVFRWATPFIGDLFRMLCPIPRFGRWVGVTRFDDVQAVLADSEAFETPYGPEMTALAGSSSNVLGVQGADHEREKAIILRIIVKPTDAAKLGAESGRVAERLIRSAPGRIDAVRDLVTRVATDTCGKYFGFEIADGDAFADWTMAVSTLLFADPTGNLKTRDLALNASARLRQVIDSAIERARRAPNADTLAGRLVALQGSAPEFELTDPKMRAILMGLAVGFIPTNTLAAGKILQQLLRRPEVVAKARKAAGDDDDAGLKAIVLELARLDPALAPGQFRYARKERWIAPGTLRARKIRVGQILLVSTMAALRDPAAFKAPTRFRLGRGPSAELVFGGSAHKCLGQELAVAQITAILAVLLRQEDLRRAPGRAGRLAWLGPFPRRLDLCFEPKGATAGQSMILVCAPVRAGVDPGQLRLGISALGNPAEGKVAAAFTATGVVHFASLSVADLGSPSAPAPYVLLELNADGDPGEAIKRVARDVGEWLGPIFDDTERGCSPTLAAALEAQAAEPGCNPWGNTGLNFNGMPGLLVADIARQEKLAAFSQTALDHYLEQNIGGNGRATRALLFVRGLIDQDPALEEQASAARPDDTAGQRLGRLRSEGVAFRDFLVRPHRQNWTFCDWTQPSPLEALWNFARSPAGLWIGAPILALFVVLWVVIYLPIAPHHWWRIAEPAMIALAGSVVATSVFVSVLLIGFVGWLRLEEIANIPEDKAPDIKSMRAIARVENAAGYAQNHFIAVTAMKSGGFTKLRLAVAMWGIKQLLRFYCRPGFVLDMGTIHYARWLRLAGSDKFLFLANYDGSWESYLEDFIMKAHPGQTAAWSNGVGFPRTSFMVTGGASDGDRFKRWVRRQQLPTPFWYSRFPHLTTEQMRNNVLIHQGLMRADTETSARAWLDCFGSTQRPAPSIEGEEIQSLVLRGFRELEHTACVALRLPDTQGQCQAWLRRMTGAATAGSGGPIEVALAFGDRPLPAGRTVANFVAFSARGLAKFGLAGENSLNGLGAFPSAFNIGMAQRDRILGDTGDSAPSGWRWTDAISIDKALETVSHPETVSNAADAVLFVYADKKERLVDALAIHKALYNQFGVTDFHILKTQPSPKGIDFEHFGFRDGISQPVIRGARRAAKMPLTRDILAAGEFILGYPGGQGFCPPSLTVRAETDPHDCLPTAVAQCPPEFPDFIDSSAQAALRDLGRNGSFLVLRQLEQNVEGFDQFTRLKAAETQNYIGLSNVIPEPIDADWIAAKMMGRRRDGSPLIDLSVPQHQARTGVLAKSPNDFTFEDDDPQGLQCPLGAHIRRANPRPNADDGGVKQQVVNRHRLLRRGRAYDRPEGTDGPRERGLLFVCLCSDIERQFEFVQQTWIASPSFKGLTHEHDPILGSGRHGGPSVFTIPTSAGAVKLQAMKSYVKVRGGGYFFLPSRSALAYLTNLKPKPEAEVTP